MPAPAPRERAALCPVDCSVGLGASCERPAPRWQPVRGSACWNGASVGSCPCLRDLSWSGQTSPPRHRGTWCSLSEGWACVCRFRGDLGSPSLACAWQWGCREDGACCLASEFASPLRLRVLPGRVGPAPPPTLCPATGLTGKGAASARWCRALQTRGEPALGRRVCPLGSR